MENVSLNIQMPTQTRNYCVFDENRVNFYLQKREGALPLLKDTFDKSNDEKEVCEALYITNRLLDDGVQGVDKLYPSLSRFNDTKSPNIQTFLAGVYRKTKVPDAFGPLVKMLIQNSIDPPKGCTFDPNEEIGGAILDYLA